MRAEAVCLGLVLTFGLVSLLMTSSLMRQRKRREAAAIQMQAIRQAVVLGFGYFEAQQALQREIEQAARDAQHAGTPFARQRTRRS